MVEKTLLAYNQIYQPVQVLQHRLAIAPKETYKPNAPNSQTEVSTSGFIIPQLKFFM